MTGLNVYTKIMKIYGRHLRPQATGGSASTQCVRDTWTKELPGAVKPSCAATLTTLTPLEIPSSVSPPPDDYVMFNTSPVKIRPAYPSFSPSPSLTFTFTALPPTTATSPRVSPTVISSTSPAMAAAPTETVAPLKTSPVPPPVLPPVTSQVTLPPRIVVAGRPSNFQRSDGSFQAPAANFPRTPASVVYQPRPQVASTASSASNAPGTSNANYARQQAAFQMQTTYQPVSMGTTVVTVKHNELKRKFSNGTREVHNKLEKNRRAHLKECFEALKSQVPAIQDEKKPSNLTILRTAIRYVQIIMKREQELDDELENLARIKMLNQQRLTNLKKELSAQWDHIDFDALLPNSIEPTKAAAPTAENVNDAKELEAMRESMMACSDLEDSTSQVKSRDEGTYYSSSSSSAASSSSPTPGVVFNGDSSSPPQIHIVESSSLQFEKLSNGTIQLLHPNSLRMLPDGEPITLVQQNGDKSPEQSSLSKVQLQSGSTFTILSDSFQKLSASTSLANKTDGARISPVANRPNISQYTTDVLSTATTLTSNPRNSNMNGCIQNKLTDEKKKSSTQTETANGLLNHSSYLVTQTVSGRQVLVPTTSHLGSHMLSTTPLLKTVSRLQPINGQTMVKPTMVMVSSQSPGTNK